MDCVDDCNKKLCWVFWIKFVGRMMETVGEVGRVWETYITSLTTRVLSSSESATAVEL